MYSQRLKAVLHTREARLLKRLDSAIKIQDYLDTLPINFELEGETYMSPRRVIEVQTAHCFEGALLAAAALAYHGAQPLIMDLRTALHDEDHVVALFVQHGRWGAISKTNHSILRYRDPIYRTARELAVSYFHEFILETGEKTLREYSTPFDLSRYAPEKWLTAGDELFSLVEALDRSRHFPIVPGKLRRHIRLASQIERNELAATEWHPLGGRVRQSDGR